MGNELSVFDFNGMGVRVIKDSGGEPWFVAKDVCAYFGEQNHHRAIRNLDEDEKGVSQINTPRRNAKCNGCQ